MHNPKISIVIPMFNCEKYIQTCIDSILNQTFEDFELIIIDDFSTDQSLKIVESYQDSRIKLFRRARNFGRSSARNFGLELPFAVEIANRLRKKIKIPRNILTESELVEALKI